MVSTESKIPAFKGEGTSTDDPAVSVFSEWWSLVRFGLRTASKDQNIDLTPYFDSQKFPEVDGVDYTVNSVATVWTEDGAKKFKMCNDLPLKFLMENVQLPACNTIVRCESASTAQDLLAANYSPTAMTITNGTKKLEAADDGIKIPDRLLALVLLTRKWMLSPVFA